MSVVKSSARLLPFWLFLLAWTVSDLVPTVLMVIWRLIDWEFGVSALLPSGLSARDSKVISQSLDAVVLYIGALASVGLQALLLRQFRDRTVGWVLAHVVGAIIAVGVAVLVLGAVQLLTGDLPNADRIIVWRPIYFGLIFVTAVGYVFRKWGWRYRSWLVFGVAISLSQPLFVLPSEAIFSWATRMLGALLPAHETLVALAPYVAAKLPSTVILGVATALVIWRFVAVHRPPTAVDAPARGA